MSDLSLCCCEVSGCLVLMLGIASAANFASGDTGAGVGCAVGAAVLSLAAVGVMVSSLCSNNDRSEDPKAVRLLSFGNGKEGVVDPVSSEV